MREALELAGRRRLAGCLCKVGVNKITGEGFVFLDRKKTWQWISV